MKNLSKTMKLTILGLMTGVLLLMAYTPLGYLNIGPLAITFNMIPVAICAITLGPLGSRGRRSFWTHQFPAMYGNRRKQRNGCCTFWHQSVFGVCSEICPQSADRPFYRLAVLGNEKENECICGVCRHWFFCRFFQHRIVYGFPGTAFR